MPTKETCVVCKDNIDFRYSKVRWLRVSTCYEEGFVCHVCNDADINPYIKGQLEYIETAWLEYDKEDEELHSRYEQIVVDRLKKCRKGRKSK